MDKDIYKLKAAETTIIGDVTVDEISIWAIKRAKELYARVKKEKPGSFGREIDIEELKTLSSIIESLGLVAKAAKLDSPAILNSRERRRFLAIQALSASNEPELTP